MVSPLAMQQFIPKSQAITILYGIIIGIALVRVNVRLWCPVQCMQLKIKIKMERYNYMYIHTLVRVWARADLHPPS